MSQVGYGPLERVDAPLPIAPVYGLLRAAEAKAAGVNIIPDFDERGIERWINGVQVYPWPPDLPEAWAFCSVGSDRQKGFGSELELPEFGAFIIHLDETCTSYSVPDQEAYKQRAVRSFTATESAAVAREILLGEKEPLNPHFADGNGEFPNGDTPTSVINGIALLEDAIAASGQMGLIHVSPSVLTMGSRSYFGFDNDSGVIRTMNGNVVIPDAGYANIDSGPEGHAAPTGNQEWIYATGPIDIRRTEPFVLPEELSQALDRGTGATNDFPNSITYRVERYYVVDWDPAIIQAAVLVDRCQTDCDV